MEGSARCAWSGCLVRPVNDATWGTSSSQSGAHAGQYKVVCSLRCNLFTRACCAPTCPPQRGLA